jgi:hemerythrin
MNAFIVWSPFYSVGHPDLDGEHKQIIAMINDLFAALDHGNPQAVILGLLDRLLKYTQTHFDHEENVMRECGYPDLEQHQFLHDALRQKTVQLRADFNPAAGPDLLRFLKQWWIDHIQGEDKKYAPYLKLTVHAT